MIMDINRIKQIIPHRYPFLLVERIVECASDSIVGIKNVSVNEPFFQGHFPNDPIMPGVLILEALAQTGGILLFTLFPEHMQKAFYFAGLDKARFRKPVRPGDQLIMKVKFLKHRAGFFKFSGKAFVNDLLVAEAEMMANILSVGAAKGE